LPGSLSQLNADRDPSLCVPGWTLSPPPHCGHLPVSPHSLLPLDKPDQIAVDLAEVVWSALLCTKKHQPPFIISTTSTSPPPQSSAMASNMECFNDFCLSCDRQIAENGVYCSQSCRLADLEKAGRIQAQTSSQLSTSASSSASSTNGFHLPPAVNFSAYKSPTSKGFDMGPSSPYYYHSTANGTYFAPPTAARPAMQRSLTPSSSRSSLASTASQSQSGISPQAATQLNSYMRSFDQTRDIKRRCTHY